MKADLTQRELAAVHAQSTMVQRPFQAKFRIPCAVLGIRTQAEHVVGVEFLPSNSSTQSPSDAFTRTVCAQIAAYVQDADFAFDVPLHFAGTPHQQKVWQALLTIPRGATRTYGALAEQIRSGPRAVGGACGDNPIPLFIPCHRVVAKNGAGGFMHQASGAALGIKAWLLKHEACPRNR